MKKFDISHWWYKKCKKNKVLDWIDDNVIWHMWTRPRSFCLTVRHWFVSNFNKFHFRLLRQAFLSYPWDGSFILELEECQIDKQIHWFNHHQTMVDEQYNEIMRSLRWAKHCVHTMNNDTDLFEFRGDVEYVPVKKDADGKCVDAEDPDEDAEFYRLNSRNLEYVYNGPRVNKRNASRFLNKEYIESDFFKTGKGDSDYYVAKCRHLYYLIRERYTDYWWD